MLDLQLLNNPSNPGTGTGIVCSPSIITKRCLGKNCNLFCSILINISGLQLYFVAVGIDLDYN